MATTLRVLLDELAVQFKGLTVRDGNLWGFLFLGSIFSNPHLPSWEISISVYAGCLSGTQYYRHTPVQSSVRLCPWTMSFMLLDLQFSNQLVWDGLQWVSFSANIARLGHYSRQAQRLSRINSYSRDLTKLI